jgi:hypothetical protein
MCQWQLSFGANKRFHATLRVRFREIRTSDCSDCLCPTATDIVPQQNVGFSNRPFGVKHFQTIRRCSVDVTHGLVLLLAHAGAP